MFYDTYVKRNFYFQHRFTKRNKKETNSIESTKISNGLGGILTNYIVIKKMIP